MDTKENEKWNHGLTRRIKEVIYCGEQCFFMVRKLFDGKRIRGLYEDRLYS